MKYINIGKFNERIIFQTLMSEPDGAGGFSQSWQNFLTTWGLVTKTSSTENIIGDVNRFIDNKRVVMRFHEGLNSTMRCLIAGKYYEIISINLADFMPKNWLELNLKSMEGI
jgi:SPP1 family predicted phage head-tail adaptor